MKVKEIMTAKPVCVTADSALDEAVTLMDDHRIRHLPVLEGERLVGIVSDRDLLQATGWLPARVRDIFDPASREKHVRDVMTSPAVTIGGETAVLSACLDLLGRSIGCLPVVEDGALVGMVSEMDVLGLFVRRCGGGPADLPVGDRMTTGLAEVTEGTTLERAANLMLSLGVRHAPVVEKGHLVGLVSDRDLHRAAGAGRSKETTVDEIMTRDVVTVSSDVRLSRVAELMVKNRVSAVPVVDDERLEGMLTLSDILDHCLLTLRDPERIGSCE